MLQKITKIILARQIFKMSKQFCGAEMGNLKEKGAINVRAVTQKYLCTLTRKSASGGGAFLLSQANLRVTLHLSCTFNFKMVRSVPLIFSSEVERNLGRKRFLRP